MDTHKSTLSFGWAKEHEMYKLPSPADRNFIEILKYIHIADLKNPKLFCRYPSYVDTKDWGNFVCNTTTSSYSLIYVSAINQILWKIKQGFPSLNMISYCLYMNQIHFSVAEFSFTLHLLTNVLREWT